MTTFNRADPLEKNFQSLTTHSSKRVDISQWMILNINIQSLPGVTYCNDDRRDGPDVTIQLA